MLWVFFLHSARGVHMLELVKILAACFTGVVSLMLFGLTFTRFLLIADNAETDN